jgi:phosphoribosylanthranilate isomerase
MIPRIKICCISTIGEAKTAVNYGADALGLVGKMPSGPGPISDELIFQIAKTVPPPVATFLLTSENSVEGVSKHHNRTKTNTIQLVDRLEYGTIKELKEVIPGIKIVQVIHVTDESSIDEAIQLSEYADALLLDSGNPALKVKVLGGTGRVHNWSISKKIVEQTKIPVFLAGGLHAGNVKVAIEQVQPFGIDLCNGVRTNGYLDEKKLEEFFNVVWK